MPVDPEEETRYLHDYLGDGVYAYIAPSGDIVLYTDRESGRHWMAFEPAVLHSLERYLSRAKQFIAEHHSKPTDG